MSVGNLANNFNNLYFSNILSSAGNVDVIPNTSVLSYSGSGVTFNYTYYYFSIGEVKLLL
jgi:hypothetical protein